SFCSSLSLATLASSTKMALLFRENSSLNISVFISLAYGNGPSRERAQRAGFRLQAPSRGQARPGVGKMHNAVERCHNFFAQFGRVCRRFDRSACHYRAWLELAACIILLRSGFVS